MVVLCLWYAYHYSRTGYVFGNPEFFRYNVRATMSGVRILLALAMRVWQSFGYMHLWVLTLLMMWAMTRPPLQEGIPSGGGSIWRSSLFSVFWFSLTSLQWRW